MIILSGKRKCYELCMGKIEKRHSDILESEFNEIMINESCAYRKDDHTQQYEIHVLDELMEKINCWTNLLPLGAGETSWAHYSPNVIVEW